jgi:hypothetical protein
MSDAVSAASKPRREGLGGGRRGPRTMLFWDYRRFNRVHNAVVVPGKPLWRPEASFTDPYTGQAGGGEVFFDDELGLWRRFSIGKGNVQTGEDIQDGCMGIFICESDDGLQWRTAELPDVKPAVGPKLAPHHVATVPKGNWGSFYRDPLEVDGYKWKLALLQWGAPAVERALADPAHPWHDIARTNEAAHPHIDLRSFIVSRDGLHWEQNFDYDWSAPGWHPEEPMFAFFNHETGEYCMTPRAGLGDRRQCIMKTRDFRNWTFPRIIMQPDLLDGNTREFYAMPVSRYAEYYVGLVWACRWPSSLPPDFAVDYFGPTTGQLAWSPDGDYWVRPTREDFIPLNPAPEFGCGMVRPESIIEMDDEIRIYSGSSRVSHGGRHHAHIEQEPISAQLLHTLRKDDFMHIESIGAWAEFITKMLTIFDGTLTMNAEALGGEVLYAFTTVKSEPIEGYGFDDCVPLRLDDSLAHPLAFKDRPALDELVGRTVRLHVRFQNARIYSFRGDYHFVDAHDWRIQEQAGLPVDTSRFAE